MFEGLLILFGSALGLLIALASLGTAIGITRPKRHTMATALARGWPIDPRDAKRDSTTQTIATATSTEVELWRVHGDNPEGPIIVMVHGWGDSRLAELGWMDVLAEQAAEVVMFDLPGHGESPYKRCTWGVDEASVIDVVMKHIKPSEKPIVLLGYSMGAALAIAAATRHDVAGVIADSPYRHPTNAIAGTLREAKVPAWPMVDLAWLLVCLRWPALARQNTVNDARQLKCPLLLLHGEADIVTRLVESQAIAEAVSSARLVTFPGAGHTRAWCDEPEAYRQSVSSFIRECVVNSSEQV